MENKQTLEYISKHLADGHSEAALREHFLAFGWTQANVDEAFAQYHHSKEVAAPTKLKKSKRKHRLKKSKWTKERWFKLGVTFAVVAVLAVGAHALLVTKNHKVQAAPPPKLTDTQKRQIDVNVLGGAVAQYVVADGGVLPTSAEVLPDGGLRLCSDACDPATFEINPLVAYQSSSINFKPYSAGLTVPDKGSIYLVAGATCTQKAGIGSASTKPRAMVILFALDPGLGLEQHCIVL